MQTSKAHLRFLRLSPRKVRLVVDLVRGKGLKEADAQLLHLNKRASDPVRKLIASAAANAVNNHGLQRDALYIRSITVDQGPTLKRYQPRAFGRAGTIRKRTSHVSVELAEREGATPAPSEASSLNQEPKTKSSVKQTTARPKKAPAKRRANQS